MPINIMPLLRHIDRQFCCALLLLLFFGVTTLYSLSYIADTGFSAQYFRRHCLYIAGALLLFAVVLSIPVYFWRSNMPWVLAGALVLCFLTLLFAPTKGATRWINIFGLSLQVSEVLKFASLLAFACWGRLIVENNTLGNTKLSHITRPMIPLGLFLFTTVAVMALQRDLGTIVVLASISVLVLVLAGMPWRYIILAGLVVLALTAVLVVVEPYRMQRLVAFVDPFSDPYGGGYAQLQSLMAYAHGGWFGVGAGGSLQKEMLPEVHNDFVIAVIAEEHGLVGFFIICATYLFIAMRAIAVGKAANERREVFGAFYAYTLAVLLLTQVAINIGGSLAVLPSKGITLPLISYGGSSLFATAVMLAVLLRLDYENKVSAGEEA